MEQEPGRAYSWGGREELRTSLNNCTAPLADHIAAVAVLTQQLQLQFMFARLQTQCSNGRGASILWGRGSTYRRWWWCQLTLW